MYLNKLFWPIQCVSNEIIRFMWECVGAFANLNACHLIYNTYDIMHRITKECALYGKF